MSTLAVYKAIDRMAQATCRYAAEAEATHASLCDMLDALWLELTAEERAQLDAPEDAVCTHADTQPVRVRCPDDIPGCLVYHTAQKCRQCGKLLWRGG